VFRLRVTVIAVGKPGALLADAIREYETRAARYWTAEFIEVKQEKAKNAPIENVRESESGRVLQKLPAGAEVFALTRVGGDAWSSQRLARHLAEGAARAKPGFAFMIGGAFGLSDEAIRRADRRMRLSTFTLPHDVARLVLAEQLYRAGTIVRGEPYHKGVE
jgi:23S rRNA (pseudouridine1915-N3)-methyltransferase